MPIATVGTPFSMRETVRGEQVARSATWAILRFLRFCHSSTYHIICKYTTFHLFNNVL